MTAEVLERWSRGTRITLDNGQVDELPLSQTIDRTAMLRAVRSFYIEDRLDPAITWEHKGN